MRIGELEIKPFQNIQNELDEFVENNLLLNMQCLSLPLIEHKETYNWEYLYLVLPILGGAHLRNTQIHTHTRARMQTPKFALLARHFIAKANNLKRIH